MSQVEETQKKNGFKNVLSKKKVKEPNNSKSTNVFIGVAKLFRFASNYEVFLFLLATLGSLLLGAALPSVVIAFGQYISVIANYQACSFQETIASSGKVNMHLGPKHDPNAFVSLIFVYIAIGTLFFGYLQAGLTSWIASRISRQWRENYLQAILRQDIEFFDTEATTGGLLVSMSEDTERIENALGFRYGSFFWNAAQLVVALIIGLKYKWYLALVAISLLPLSFTISFFAQTYLQRTIKQQFQSYEQASDIANQYFANIRTVASYNAEKKAVGQFDENLILPTKFGAFEGFWTGLITGTTVCFHLGGYALAFWFGSKKVIQGDVAAADALVVVFAINLGGTAFGQIAPNVRYFIEGSIAAQRMSRVIDRKPKIDKFQKGLAPKDIDGYVELQDVNFAYPSRPDLIVFQNINLKIDKGSTVALVGQSGSGKSTIVQLVQRFYDPMKGRVLIDGQDLREYDLMAIRQYIGLVSQEPVLLSGTMESNILLGRPGATKEDVINAAKSANVYSFIDSLPYKFQTEVGEKGVQLSGGQKQRIAIARAILKNPKILLLDEATSALDTKSEKVVQDALDRMSIGRTTIVVAHRLSTIRHANMIYVIKKGEVVEQGTHDDLIKNDDGIYTALVRVQIAEKQKKGGIEDDDDDVESQLKEESQRQMKLSKRRLELSQHTMKQSKRSLREIEEREASTKFSFKQALNSFRKLQVTQQEGVQEAVTGKAKNGKVQVVRDENGKEIKLPSPFKRLIMLSRPEFPILILGIILSMLSGGEEISQAILTSRLLGGYIDEQLAFNCRNDINSCTCEVRDRIQSGAQTIESAFTNNINSAYHAVLVSVYSYIGVAVGLLLVLLFENWSFTYVGAKLSRRVRTKLMDAILRQNVGWFDEDENSTGALVSNLASNAIIVRGAVGDIFALVLTDTAIIAGCLVIAFTAGGSAYKLTLVVIAILPLIIGGNMIRTKVVSGSMAKSGDQYAKANTMAQEATENVRVVQSYTLESEMEGRFRQQIDVPFKKTQLQSHWMGIVVGGSFLALYCSYAIANYYGGVLVSRGELNSTQLFQVVLAIIQIGVGFSNSQANFPTVTKAFPAMNAIFKILDRKPPIDSYEEKGKKLDNFQGNIQLKNIFFFYPQRAEVVIFENFNLTVPAGKQLALVGESGSGKSTVVSLIERFYDPQKGSVLFDGVNIKDINLKWLRQVVALVSQEPIIFTTTIFENIRLGDDKATEEDVQHACEVANIDGFINQLPEKLQTRVGDKGIRLSGGQKQRVAIARALLKNARVLLLDEATSALDAESERLVQEALDKLMMNRTSVTIAHRLSTIRNADIIAVCQKGKLIEQGSHQELMGKPGGAYKALVQVQSGQQ